MTDYYDCGSGDGKFDIKLYDLYGNLMLEKYLTQKEIVCEGCKENDEEWNQLCENCQNIVRQWFQKHNFSVKMEYSALCGGYDSETEEHEIELPKIVTEEKLHEEIRFERNPKGMEFVRMFLE